MRKEYKIPCLTVAVFAAENVITASGITKAQEVLQGTDGVSAGNVTTVEGVLSFT